MFGKMRQGLAIPAWVYASVAETACKTPWCILGRYGQTQPVFTKHARTNAAAKI
ncbi:hypothetical protein [Neisseria weaveri]|uniref:hypothetical protein n=1 Tax=Neisseria weaveri TaxID=28091 RepID=UPI0002231D1F|nr:hypothetical protein [Neisseria weaveri]EGV36727.1 hypothetical protein l11_16760 [Neisseria weaveri LMG 5135]